MKNPCAWCVCKDFLFFIAYSKVQETELVLPSEEAASASETEYLVFTALSSVLVSDDEAPLPEEELPLEDELLPEEEWPLSSSPVLLPSAIALETAKAAINAKIVSNFFMKLSFQNLRVIVGSVNFKLF